MLRCAAPRPAEVESGGGTAAAADEGGEMGAIRAMAVVPRARVCATGGDDGTVQLWDLDTHRRLNSLAMGEAVSSLAFEEQAAPIVRLAVGCEDGRWDVVRVAHANRAGGEMMEPAFSQRAEGALRRRVSDLRFSPDGEYLAVGCADSAIYLYDADYRLVAVCRGHSSAITHIDFTEDSCVLRSNCLGHELRFWDVPSGQQISLASACRDLAWATFSVTLGWHCQGIFRTRADGTGVHCVDRSPDGTLLATVDDFGIVNLLRYPCVQAQAKGKPNRAEFYGHASAALACRWAVGTDGKGESLLSVGGLDLTLFQWTRRP